MRHMLVALAALCLATAASAQWQSTTNCQKDYFGNYRCTTNGQPQSQINWGLLNPNASTNAANSTMDGFERGRRMVQDAQEQQLRQRVAQEQQAAAEQQRLLAQQEQTASAEQARVMADGIALARTQSIEAGKLVAAGDCESAQRYALQEGNFILAQQVKDYCATGGR